MAASGTYGFSLANSDITVEAFERCGVLPAQLSRHHWISARRSLNLLLVDWANRDGPNLWEVQGPTTINLVAGQPTYSLAANTVSILDAYYTTVNGGGAGINTDRILVPMSRDEYAEFPNKLQQGVPSLYWHNKQMTTQQTLTLYENPQFAAPGFLVSFYWLSHLQDANQTGGETPDVPYLGYEALCADLALWLSRKPTLVGKLDPQMKQDIKEAAAIAWERFSSQNREDAPIRIQPRVQAYYDD